MSVTHTGDCGTAIRERTHAHEQVVSIEDVFTSTKQSGVSYHNYLMNESIRLDIIRLLARPSTIQILCVTTICEQ